MNSKPIRTTRSAARPRPAPTVKGAPQDGFGIGYFNTLILVSPDSTAVTGMVPARRGERVTVPVLEYLMICAKPYVYTQDEVQFEVHVRHRGLQAKEVKERRHQLLADFFGRSRACLRASSLPKKYGWGVHFDGEGRVALHAVDSAEYRRLAADPAVTKVYAMRSAREKAGEAGAGKKGLKAWREAFGRQV